MRLWRLLGHPYRPGRSLSADRQEHGDGLRHVMDFYGDKIRHMTKIWNAGWAMKELGWG